MIGKISLIGAGLGDPELLTLKALRKIQAADVVVYDRLINPAILNYAASRAEKIYVGKNPTFHPVPQDQIEEILITKARAGKNIVRLKSGDPYVFGRGGEEGAHLKAEGIPFEVIPGVTSAIGGLAYAGIPITHRDFVSSFHVFTGHLKSEDNQIDWPSAAKAEGTLVFLMGMSELAKITENLITFGKDPATPAAIIQWASRKNQKTVVGTLADIYTKAQAAQLQPPSLIVIGGVVTQREHLNFFEERPLFNSSVAVPYTQEKKMASQLTDLGAEVIELPKPHVEQLANQLTAADLRENIIFTDVYSIEVFAKWLIDQQLSWQQLSNVQVIAVGKKTANALLKQGIIPKKIYQSMPTFIAEHQAKMKQSLLLGEAGVLDKYADESALATLWRTHREYLPTPIPDLWQTADFLCFPSSKTANVFITSLTSEELALLAEKKIIVMGAVTAAIFATVEISVIQTPQATFASVIATLIAEKAKL
ncbi:uroporphyrinogen III methyltransferase/synthase [Enterococcus sp. PF1-24]|uniref:uroporphyrinogen-III C-methyltransferase n=1 Tax=unclassified Enterococcus TaxID=2608891 RepID=UPI002476987F|nr:MULTISPECIES: uroporphyrinogen-III C-methyltransferase [unclassified Enterococcus]MDH6363379.1 uroporphyrinogen III methyltransferase/synthase [Enterococcus sp. PFB1-1]MDH6400320.1 uroporphyrinogen III methyltransferase/synthase [Enterococcus sp. PF1-24]